jgi:hypothetical protein
MTLNKITQQKYAKDQYDKNHRTKYTTHTHTHTYVCVCVYICECVCVCVSVSV